MRLQRLLLNYSWLLLNPISSRWVSRGGLVRAGRTYLLLILEGKLSPKLPAQAAKARLSGGAEGAGTS